MLDMSRAGTTRTKTADLLDATLQVCGEADRFHMSPVNDNNASVGSFKKLDLDYLQVCGQRIAFVDPLLSIFCRCCPAHVCSAQGAGRMARSNSACLARRRQSQTSSSTAPTQTP